MIRLSNSSGSRGCADIYFEEHPDAIEALELVKQALQKATKIEWRDDVDALLSAYTSSR
jgi:hypothetical protein